MAAIPAENCRRQRDHECEPRSEGRERIGQPVPRSPRQAGQGLAPAPPDEAGADQHDERSGENREI